MRSKIIYRLVSLFITLLVVSGSFMSAKGATQSTTFKPVADGFVSASTPATNHGTATNLKVDASPKAITYVRFNVAGLVGQKVTQALLKIYANSASPQGLAAKAVVNDNWGETTLNYINAPVMGTGLASSAAVSKDSWVSLNVTSYVTASGMYSFGITTSGATAISLGAREAGAKAPQLVVTTSSQPTPTPTPAPGTDWQPSFPIRAAFYYPWFPEAWTQQGIHPYTNYTPKLGYYSSRDQNIIQRHIGMMQYGHIDAAIASWWGQGSQTDTKIAGLLSASAGTNFRWALYYENESQGNPSASQIQADLIYIHDHYGKNPNFLRVNGKFVVFVYADANDGCGTADRWVQANTVGAYVVLKVFPGYAQCTSQPDSWHQYCPAVAADSQGSISYTISPGFWLKGNSERLTRDITRWNQNVRDMVASGAKWQLITTFSEWGEGTIVEPAAEWASASGYGQYLDALHANP